MTQLFLTKVLQNIPHLFLVNHTFRSKSRCVLVPDTSLYYLALHLKLTSRARSCQLVELFAYENPVSPVSQPSSKSFLSTSSLSPVLSYHFHNLLSQERLFLFTSNLEGLKDQAPKSIGELFFSATWLEREVGEMHGVCFEGKKDLRNLMLQYGDTSSPFRKTYPPIGTREVCYDPVTDALAQVPVSIQS